MKYGYARVSTDDQSTALTISDIKAPRAKLHAAARDACNGAREFFRRFAASWRKGCANSAHMPFRTYTELLRIFALKMENSLRKRCAIPLRNFTHSTRNWRWLAVNRPLPMHCMLEVIRPRKSHSTIDMEKAMNITNSVIAIC
jgi:hypothetical protein